MRAARAVALAFAGVAAAGGGGGCARTVRADDWYARPLERAAAPRARLEARWRRWPAPAGCATAGAPLVLLPALGLTQHTWAGVTAQLRACRPRVLVDLPGVGEAPAATAIDASEAARALADVVDAVAPEGGRVVLVGHSLGAAVATELAATLGARVEALVLVAAPVAPFAVPSWAHWLTGAALWPPLLHLAGAFEGVAHGIARVSGGGGDRPSALDLGLIAADWSDRRRRLAIFDWYRGYLTPPRIAGHYAALAAVRAPVLLVWGADDEIVPPAVMEAVAARLRAAAAVAVTTERVPGVGHLVPLAAPRLLAAAIDRFLSGLPPSARPAQTRSASVVAPGRRAGEVVWGPARELFPLVGVNVLFPLDGRTDLSLVAGLARGGVDARYPLESGRIVVSAGATLRVDGGGAASFAYLRATGRLELVWRWGGGFHVDGTLLVDPRGGGRAGGYGAVGYTTSVVPWLRGFVGGGALPGEGGRALVGFEIDWRLTGWLY